MPLPAPPRHLFSKPGLSPLLLLGIGILASGSARVIAQGGTQAHAGPAELFRPAPRDAWTRFGVQPASRPGMIDGLTFFEAGKRLLVTEHQFGASPPEGPGGLGYMASVWAAPSLTFLRSWRTASHVAVAHDASRDGSIVALAGLDRTIEVWSTRSQSPLLRIDIGNGPDTSNSSVSVAPDGHAVAGTGSQVSVWRVSDGTRTHVLPPPKGAYCDYVRFTPDGKRLVALAGNPPVVCCWSYPEGKLLGCWRLPGDSFCGRVLTLADRCVILGDGLVQVRRLATGKVEREWRAGVNAYRPSAAASSPDETSLAIEEPGGKFRIWSLATGLPAGPPIAATSPPRPLWRVGALAYSPDGRYLAVGSTSGSIRMWDTRAGGFTPAERGHTGPLAAVAYSPDGKSLLSAGADRQAIIWDTRRRSPLTAYATPSSVTAATFVGDETAALGCADGRVHLVATRTGRMKDEIRTHEAPIRAIGTTTGDSFLVTLDQHGWLARSARLPRAAHRTRLIEGELPDVVAVDPAGSGTAAYLSLSTDLYIRPPQAGRPVVSFELEQPIASLAVAPGGGSVAAATRGSLELFRGPGWAQRASAPMPEDWDGDVALAFSPDGRYLAVTHGRHLRVWESRTLRPLRTLFTEDHQPRCLAFSPRGGELTTGGADGSLLVWRVAPGPGPARFLARNRQAQLEKAWADLASEDPVTGEHALQALVNDPAVGLPFLAARLGPFEPTPSVAALVARLDDDDFATREDASSRLAAMRGQLVGVLRQAARATRSVEVRLRLLRVLGEADKETWVPGDLREERALAALEYMATPGSLAHLRRLAAGMAGAWRTEAARAAFRRAAAPAGE